MRPLGVLALVFLGAWALTAPRAKADKPEGVTAQTLKLPNGPSSLKGLGESFEPNIATGTGSYGVKIEVPPGFVQPSVSLQYAGGSGKSELGLGWQIPTLHIYRSTDKGAPDFDEDDRFSVSGPGINDELVRVNAKEGLYRLKNEGAFVLFERDAKGDRWVVHFPSGETALLGQDANARQTSRGRSYKWFVSRQDDRFGHFTSYKYLHDAGRVYLESIDYQQHAAAAYQNKVAFSYATRPDVFTDYRYGDECTTQLRLTSVKVFHGARQLRTYELAYDNPLLFSLLRSVHMTGEGGKLAMPTLRFDYLGDTREGGELVSIDDLPPLEGLVDGLAELDDVNGDGLPDLIYGVSSDYHYYTNLDGRSFSPDAITLENSPDRHLFEAGVLFADMNGDGFRDLVHPQGDRFRYYPAGRVENGRFVGFREAVELDTQAGGFHFGDPRVKLTDLNSDGRTDLLWQKPGLDSVLLNLKDKLVEQATSELPVDVDFSNPRVMLADFNGDGELDLVLNGLNYTSSRVRIWFGLGKGKFTTERAMRNVPSGDPAEFYFEDVNNDGQTDLVRSSGSWATYYLNDGDLAYTGQRGDFNGLPSQSTTRKVLFADMNGNGSRDLVWYTTGDELIYLELMKEPHPGLLSRVDNGMGAVTTLSYRSSTDDAIEARTQGRPWRHPMRTPVPVLSEIRSTDSFDKLGFTANVTRTSYVYRDGYYDGKEREFRGFARVDTTEHGDSNHESLITETHMHVGRNPLNGADEEILKGKPFMQLQRNAQGALLASSEIKWERRRLCQEDLVGVVRVILPRCSNFSNLDEAKDELVAFAVQRDSLQGAWEGTQEPRFTATHAEFDSWGNATRTERLGEVKFTGWHEPGEPFVVELLNSRIGDDEVLEATSFIYEADEWLIGLPYEQSIETLAGARLRHTRSYYDGSGHVGLPLGQAERGRVVRETLWLAEENRWVDSRRVAFDSHGQPTSTLDAKGNERQLDYDSETGFFAVGERAFADMGALEFRAGYDRAFGLMTNYVDLDNHETLLEYDALGRLALVVGPEDSDDRPSARYSYSYGSSGHPISTTSIAELVDRDAGTYRESHVFSDGSGRTRLTKAQAESPQGWIGSGFVAFSARGAPQQTFESFFSPHPQFESAPSDTPASRYELDALGRETRAFAPATDELGSTFTLRQYLPFEVRLYDERETSTNDLRHPAISRMDGRGRVREVEKYNSDGSSFKRLRWRVDYNAVDEITAIADPGWSAEATSNGDRYRRYYGYDSLGRPLWIRDPSMGLVRYEHDDAGNLTRRLDALGQEVVWEYGAINRPTARHVRGDVNGRPNQTYSFHYDRPDPNGPLADATNLRGRLSWVEFPTGADHYSYDLHGRQTKEARLLWNPLTSNFGSQSRDLFVQTSSHTADNELASVEFSGGFRAEYQYNERRLLSRITAKFAGESTQPFRGMAYDARGLVASGEHANGLKSCRRYDERAQLVGTLSGRVEQINCDATGGTAGLGMQHLYYQRLHDGMIARTDDLSVARPSLGRLDASYGYDSIHQLIESQDENATLRYRYDEIQNLVARDLLAGTAALPTGEFRYGERGAGPNMITAAGSEQYSYDALGQLRTYNAFGLTFDPEGQLVSADRTDQHLQFYYDAWGERRIAIAMDQNGPSKVQRFVFASYQLREQAHGEHGVYTDEVWRLETDLGTAEMRRADGIAIDATLLNQLSNYLGGIGTDTRPLPAEFMDLDGDGDSFDQQDFDTAQDALVAKEKAGGVRDLWLYHHRDHLGGTTHVTDSTGELVAHQAFHPYGVRSARSGAIPLLGYAGANDEVDAELGLLYFQTRYYAPKIGRWISPDRWIGESPTIAATKVLEANLYSYARNNPIFFVDPTGRDGETVDLPRTTHGSIPRNKRAHAADADVIHVDRFGNQITQQQAEKMYGAGTAMYSKMRMRPEAAEAFRRMREYAARDGIDVTKALTIYSGFRPDSRQQGLAADAQKAGKGGFVAKAGGSEHRTGLGMDIIVNPAMSLGDNNNSDRKNREKLMESDAYKWLEANASRFGFAILGVQRDKQGNINGYDWGHFEPWHISYNPAPGANLPPPPAAPSPPQTGSPPSQASPAAGAP